MHRAVRVIFLLKSPIASTPYHRKIKSYPSSVEKTFSLLSWENLNSSCEVFWVQAVPTSPVDTIGLYINNWAHRARVSLSWQVAFTPKIKKKKFYSCSVFQCLWIYLLQNRISPKQNSKRKSVWAYIQATHLRGAETCMQINCATWYKIAYLQNALGVLKQTISEDF